MVSATALFASTMQTVFRALRSQFAGSLLALRQTVSIVQHLSEDETRESKGAYVASTMNQLYLSKRLPEYAPICLAVLLISLSGCSLLVRPVQYNNWNNGYTMVLPGIDSRHFAHEQLTEGLRDGGVDTAMEIHDWTSGNPGFMLVHLRWLERNKRQAQEVADKIVEYQDRYPGKPVHLVGHSGGAGVALFALEALPEGRRIDSVVLLAACISPDYDLHTALERCDGLWNYYSLIDAPLLVAGTTFVGTIDNHFEPAAGAIGFRPPKDLSAQEQSLYHERLHQRHFQIQDLAKLNFGSHYGAMSRLFAKDEIAKVLTRAPSIERGPPVFQTAFSH